MIRKKGISKDAIVRNPSVRKNIVSASNRELIAQIFVSVMNVKIMKLVNLALMK